MKHSKIKIFLVLFFFSLFTVQLLRPQPIFAASSIRITELMYDPSGNGDKEFIELYNGSNQTVNLSGWSMYGVDFVFASGTTLAPYSYLSIARNQASLQAVHPGARIVGQYGGKLLGGGETVRVINSNGGVVSQVSYSYGGGWPTSPKNGGPSLSLIRTSANEELSFCWAASTINGGTPSGANAVASKSNSGCTDSAYQTVSTGGGSSTANQNTTANSSTSTSRAAAKKKEAAKKKAAEAAAAEQTSQTVAQANRKQSQKLLLTLGIVLLVGLLAGGVLFYRKFRHSKQFKELMKKKAVRK